MKSTVYSCDHCKANCPNGAVNISVKITRPAREGAATALPPGMEVFAQVAGTALADPSQIPFQEHAVEVCTECDGKIQRGELNLFTVKPQHSAPDTL